METLILAIQDLPSFPTQAPPPVSSPWWPYVGWAVTILISLFAGGLAWLRELYFKRVDIQRDADAKRLALELEGLKLDFEQRKNYTDRMELDRNRLEKEIERKDGELWKAFAIIQDRDKTIKEQHEMIFELKGKVSRLELEILNLKKMISDLKPTIISE